MGRPKYWITPTQGFLLFWAALHFSTWDLCTPVGVSKKQMAEGRESGYTALPVWSLGKEGQSGGLAIPDTFISPMDPGPISGASMVSDSTMNETSMTPLTCQSFQCSGERCYQDEAHSNNTEPCHNATHCELYRFNSTSYTARCSSECGNSNATDMCMAHSSVSMALCTVECCASPNCLSLNATAYGDLPPTTTPAPTTTTTKAPPKNGKVCSSFTCHGDGCYKGKKASVGCTVGFDYCEMKKTGPHYVAGCSKLCKTSGKPCAAGSVAPCFQECCPAMPKASCLKLDGKVHFNQARSLAPAPLLQLLTGAALLGLNYALLFPLGLH